MLKEVLIATAIIIAVVASAIISALWPFLRRYGVRGTVRVLQQRQRTRREGMMIETDDPNQATVASAAWQSGGAVVGTVDAEGRMHIRPVEEARRRQ
jgi:ribosomal protein L14